MSEPFELPGDCLRRLAFRDEARREFVYGVASPDQRWLNDQLEREYLLQHHGEPPAASPTLSSSAETGA